MGLGHVAEVLFMPPGLGGLGIGDNPIGKKESAAVPQPQAPVLPNAPKPEEAQEKAADMARKRRAVVAQDGKTTYTSPLGAAGEAAVARKTLLGQ